MEQIIQASILTDFPDLSVPPAVHWSLCRLNLSTIQMKFSMFWKKWIGMLPSLSGKQYPRKKAKIGSLIPVQKKTSAKSTKVSGFIKKRMSSWQRKGIIQNGDALAKYILINSDIFESKGRSQEVKQEFQGESQLSWKGESTVDQNNHGQPRDERSRVEGKVWTFDQIRWT